MARRVSVRAGEPLDEGGGVSGASPILIALTPSEAIKLTVLFVLVVVGLHFTINGIKEREYDDDDD